MTTVTELGPRLGIAPTCAALGLPRATYYRRRRPQRAPVVRSRSHRALSPDEATTILARLHEPRFVDLAPAEVYATLLDAGEYLCSERTMYRVLAAHQEVRERRIAISTGCIRSARGSSKRWPPASARCSISTTPFTSTT